MSLSIGIVGLPNVGKSTLFNALTQKGVLVANYPFATIDPSVGVVAVPDFRLGRLSAFSHSNKTIPAAVEFVDIAGLVRGASEGEGLGNQFLSHIREVDAVAEVVRLFDDTTISHVHGEVDPLSDIEVINAELALSDLQTIEKRRGSLRREVKRGNKEALAEESLLARLAQILQAGGRAADVMISDAEAPILKSLHLLTSKPLLYVFNKKANGNNLDEQNDERYHRLLHFLESQKAKWVIIDAHVEDELKDIAEDDKVTFRQEFGVHDDGIDKLIAAAYDLLGLMSYFTTGEDETRAWTIKCGSTAPEAGSAIHTDFKTKFIKAEVVAYETLMAAGSYAKARERGWVRTEGKEYVVQDGDVVEFKI